MTPTRTPLANLLSKMSQLDYLRRARTTANAAFVRFVADYPRNPSAIHLFFEGDDDESFYMNFIGAVVPGGTLLVRYRCRNKRGVLYVYRKLDWGFYDPNRVLFFVDKDHSDFVSESLPEAENIFVTDCYSIENYVVCTHVFDRCTRELLHIDCAADEHSAMSQAFAAQLQMFHRMMLLIDAWIIYARRQGEDPNLSNLDPGLLFSIDPHLQLLRRVNSVRACWKVLEERCRASVPLNEWREILALARDLKSNHTAKHHLRGKYELWFLVTYLERLRDLVEHVQQPGDRRKVIRTSVSQANAIEVLGPRVPLPARLSTFLRRLWP